VTPQFKEPYKGVNGKLIGGIESPAEMEGRSNVRHNQVTGRGPGARVQTRTQETMARPHRTNQQRTAGTAIENGRAIATEGSTTLQKDQRRRKEKLDPRGRAPLADTEGTRAKSAMKGVRANSKWGMHRG